MSNSAGKLVKLQSDDIQTLFSQFPLSPGADESEWGPFSFKGATPFVSSDNKLTLGIHSETRNKLIYQGEDTYGVDEFMWFLDGGVTLTDLEGNATQINAGEAVMVSKEWQGIWETEGYKKIYLIYDAGV